MTIARGMDLDAIITEFRGPLIGLLAAWGANPPDAIELAGDSFAEAYISRSRFKGRWDDPGAVGAWLRGIAHNLFHSSLRQRDRLHAFGGAQEEAGHGARTLASDAQGNLEQLEQEEQASQVQAAMDELTGPHRTVLLMRYVEGSSLGSIGALLGLSVRAVEGRLRRARLALKAKLEGEMAQEERK